MLPKFVWALLLAVGCDGLRAAAQGPAPQIRERIVESDRVLLPGSRHPVTDLGKDLGPMAPEQIVHGITLVLKRSAAQQAELDALLTAQQEAGSPQFHRWLTPESFAARFGMADADLAAAAAWIKARGFTVDEIPRSRDRITFTGTAAQVGAAFGTELHRFLVDDEPIFAPVSQLSLPAALAPVTAAVLHLSDLRPRPSAKALPAPQPAYTDGSTGAHFLSPVDILVMYDALPIPSKFWSLSQGQGQTLAVVGQSYVDRNSSALSAFSGYLSGGTVTPVLVPGSGVQAVSPLDLAESEIDVEYATGIAPKAQTLLVYVGDNANYNVFDALTFAITANVAPVVSISYGICEPLLSATELDQLNGLFQQAAAQGQTLVASSGDSGSTGCARYTTAQGVSSGQQQALAVDFPADSPYVTAVGGTQMSAGTYAAGSNPFWASTNTILIGNSLLSYVPELAWNEGSATRPILAGGGGASTHFPRPAWQAGVPGVPGGSFRLLPDVALQASLASPGFLMCTDDAAFLGGSGAASSCTTDLRNRDGRYTVGGGTSFAAPIFAGFIAILNGTKAQIGQGSLNPTLYQLASVPSVYAAAFHDISSGTIACVPGATNCAADGLSGFAATPGFDEATGLGSVDLNQLIAAWPGGPAEADGLEPTTLTVGGGGSVANPGDPTFVLLNVFVSAGAAQNLDPTGTLSVRLDGALLDDAVAFTGHSSVGGDSNVTYHFNAPALVGTHVVTVTYTGDATHRASKSSTTLGVGNPVPSGGLTLSVANLTLASGGSGTSPVVATPTDGYHGRVFWSLAATSGSLTQTACYGLGALRVGASGSSTATLHLGLGAACGAPNSAHEHQLLPPVHAGALPGRPGPPGRAPGGTVFAGLLACGAWATRRRLSRSLVLGVALLGVTVAGVSGCGGGAQQGSSPTSPTPAPTSPGPSVVTLTLTGTDSVNPSIRATTTFTLTVN